MCLRSIWTEIVDPVVPSAGAPDIQGSAAFFTAIWECRLAIRAAEFGPEADITFRVVGGKPTTTKLRNS
jgi:hypothetical protein